MGMVNGMIGGNMSVITSNGQSVASSLNFNNMNELNSTLSSVLNGFGIRLPVVNPNSNNGGLTTNLNQNNINANNNNNQNQNNVNNEQRVNQNPILQLNNSINSLLLPA
jgi:hypothetical protein